MRTAALAWALAALAGCGPADASLPSRTPVVLLTIDSLRYERLGLAGHVRDTTPRLDRLAREGAFFTRCYAQSSWTLPSMLSLVTSLPPPSFGVERGPRRGQEGASEAASGERLSEAHETLVDALAAVGYQTAGFSTNSLLSARFGFSQGFGHFEEHLWQDAAEILGAARRWLPTRDARPLFLWLHLFDPHFERYGTPPVYRAPASHARHFATSAALAPADAVGRDYDRQLRSMDDELARFLDELEEAGLGEDALLVVAVDHGEEFDEHGLWGHARSVHEALVRVPLWLRLPRGRAAGVRVDAVVRNLDVAPTVLDLLGLAVPPSMRGESLRPLLEGRAAPARAAYGDTRRYGLDLHFWVDAERGRKLVLDLRSGRRSLHALGGLAEERVDLAAREPALADELERALRAALGAMERERARAEPAALDARDLDALGDLGYVEDGGQEEADGGDE